MVLDSSNHVPSCRIGRGMKTEEGMKKKAKSTYILFLKEGFKKLVWDNAAYISLARDVT